MKKNYPKTVIPVLVGIALMALCAGNASAQDNTVTGKTYAIYFLTALNSNPDNFDDTTLSHMHITFTKGGDVAVEMIDGHGLHFSVPGLFIAYYFAVGVRMGFETMPSRFDPPGRARKHGRVLLTITTTREPATDLGYLLHKHPDRPQSFAVASG